MATFTARQPKDPADTLVDYAIDWSPYMDGDTLASSVWAITGPDALLTKDGETNSSVKATVLVSGGTPGATYVLTNTVTFTSNSQNRQRSVELLVSEL